MEVQSRNALKVGIFMMIWLLVLVGMIFSITDRHLGQDGYTFTVTFSNAGGIDKGAPVQYAGVEVGEVKGVHLVTPEDASAPSVELEVWMPAAVRVHKNVNATISTFGLLGEKFVNLTPADASEGFLEVSSAIYGTETIALPDIMQEASLALTQFNGLMWQLHTGDGTIAKLVRTDELHQSLMDVVHEMKGLVAEVKSKPWVLLRGPNTSPWWMFWK